MDSLQWYDYVRLITGLLALITLYNIARRFNRDVHTYTQRLKELSWAFQAFLLLTFIGSIESVAQNVGWGWRIPCTVVLVAATFRASLRSEGLVKENE